LPNQLLRRYDVCGAPAVHAIDFTPQEPAYGVPHWLQIPI
jgi:hypothetical protein